MYKVILDFDEKKQMGIISSEYLDVIRIYLSIPNPVYALMKRKYGENSHTSPRLYAINPRGYFDIGLYFTIVKLLNNTDIDYDITTTPLLSKHVLIGYNISEFQLPKLSKEPREFQYSGVIKGLKYGSGVFLIGTGGGKTLLMALLDQSLKCFDNKTNLIIMPANLVKQTYKEFISFGIDPNNISLWNADNSLEVKPIIISSYQTLSAQLVSFKKGKIRKILKNETKNDYENYLKEFNIHQKDRLKRWNKQKREILKQLNDLDVIMLDEVHSLRKSNKVNKVIKLLSAKHRYGFTGTMPDNKIDEWNIIGKIGPIIEDVDSFDLRQQGYLSPVKAYIVKLHYKNPIKVKPDVNDSTKAYFEESNWIFVNEFRNKTILNICKKCNNNILIIVDKLLHGSTIYKNLSNNTNKQVYWISGETSMDAREDIRELMENNDNIICIAMSKCFSTGINITNIHYIMFAQGGKAKIKLVQSIGRGLRLHENKDKLVIFDISDNLHYGIKHLTDRISRYISEQIPYEIKDIRE